MKRYGLITIISIAIALVLSQIPRVLSAQVIETTEARETKVDKDAEEEKLEGLCLTTVESYEEARGRVDERIVYLENVAIMGDILALKDEMEAEKGIPKECAKEVGAAIDHMIEEMLGEKADNIEMESLKSASSDMEAEMMPLYLELSQAFDEVCDACGKKPLKLAGDPLDCRRPGSEGKRINCSEAQTRLDNSRDALVFRRHLCGQAARLDGMDQILYWFQGRDDLPITCAVQVKEFMDEIRKRAEGPSERSRYAFAVAKEECGHALFPIYVRYGMAIKNVCDSCKKADNILKNNGMSCY